MILKAKDLRSNIVQFQKGRFPRNQLIELFLKRVVLLKPEKVDEKGKALNSSQKKTLRGEAVVIHKGNS